jgi:sRNA-binding protein
MGKKDERKFIEEVGLVHSVLMTKYPDAFFGYLNREHIRPLKLGIAQDILKDNPKLKYRAISYFLHLYTNKNRYLIAICKGKYRIDLAGNEYGEISEAHRKHAKDVMLLRPKKQEEQHESIHS